MTMTMAMALRSFGYLLLIVGIVVLTSLRKNRLELRRLREEIELLEGHLRTPEERVAEARRLEAIEAQKRQIHGLFDSGGC